MGSIIDFSGIKNCEQAIRKTWDEFRECLAAGVFSYDEIEKAKKQKFLMVYDDLFYKHSGIDQSTIVFKDLKDKLMGFLIMIVFFLKKSISKKIIVLALLMWNGFIWRLAMIMTFTNVHRLNVEPKEETCLDFVIFNETPNMICAN